VITCFVFNIFFGALCERFIKKDCTYQVQTGVSNTTSAFKSVEEERQGREEACGSSNPGLSGDATNLAKAIVHLRRSSPSVKSKT
jgi:hypothetical protein